MKILFISMPSVHVIRWIENLIIAECELYWFDVLGRGSLETFSSVHQYVNWKTRKIKPIKGEFFLYKNLPKLHSLLIPYLEKTANEALNDIILEIQPDIIHSFEMQGCSYPILKTMKKFSEIAWIYSCWGSDLFYYKESPSHLRQIKNVLKRVNYIHTDCERDYILATNLGFKGKYLGVIPGGAGFRIERLINLRLSFYKRKIILIKGYEHKFGRALNVIKALENMLDELQKFEIVVFGAHQSIIDYVFDKKLPFKVNSRHELKHEELLKLMGRSLIYIGNNISDGMPNTLLEAIVMGAFPIQSNPGGVTEEIITNGKNGLLIEEPENIKAIQQIIQLVVNNNNLLQTAQTLNYDIALKRLDYDLNKKKIIQIYKDILQE